MALIFICVGLIQGIQIGNKFGSKWAIIGGIAGLLIGIILFLLLISATILIYKPFEIFKKLWRPDLPICENGKCVGYESYKICKTPDETIKNMEGFSPISYLCNCGNLYASRRGKRGQWHWMRILPDGSVQPYLKHSVYGRWKPDESEQTSPDMIKTDISNRSVSVKDVERYLHQSQKAIAGHVIFTLVTLIAAFIIWNTWNAMV